MPPSTKASFAFLILTLMFSGCAAPPQEGLSVRTGRHGEQIISYRPSSSPSVRAAKRTTKPPVREKTYVVIHTGVDATTLGRLLASGASLPLKLPVEFQDEGAALIHLPTGARLPREHLGCRLAAIAPLPAGYAKGGIADYDCRPATDLNYVTVVFAGDVAELTQEDLGLAAARVAGGFSMQDGDTPAVACFPMNLGAVVGHVNRELAGAQCGARWKSPADDSTTYGTATLVLVRGANYVALTNTCLEPACDANRVKFGKFYDTFDQSGLKSKLQPVRAQK